MIITEKELKEIESKWDSLSKEEQLEYSNPCIEKKGFVRVGQVFDEDLGYWRQATKYDF